MCARVARYVAGSKMADRGPHRAKLRNRWGSATTLTRDLFLIDLVYTSEFHRVE